MKSTEQEPQVVMGYWTYLLLRVLIPKLGHWWKRYAKRIGSVLGGVVGVFALVEGIAIGMYEYTSSKQERWDAEVLPPCISEQLTLTNTSSEAREHQPQLPTQGDLTEPLVAIIAEVTERVAQERMLQQQAERHRAAYQACLGSLPARPSQNAFVNFVDDCNDWIGSWF